MELTRRQKLQALFEALKATGWESIPSLILGAYIATADAGKILTTPAADLTTLDRVGILVGVLAFAVLAAMVKHHNLMTYGVSELSLAMGLTWTFLSRQMGADSVANAVALMGITFLTSRAIQNIYEAAKKNIEERNRMKALLAGR